MNLEQFLQAVLPPEGYRCIATPNDKGFGFSHSVFETNLLAAQRAGWLGKKKDVYFACSSLKEPHIVSPSATGHDKKKYRVKENLLAAKSFWLDLDVEAGNDKKYGSREEAISHLFEFLESTKLPRPIIIDSGYGAHIYFPLTEGINIEMWVKVSWALHSLVEGFGLKADRSRTHDASSVLRPVGTYNFKNPADPKLVKAVYSDFETVPVTEFASRVVTAIKQLQAPVIQAPRIQAATNRSVAAVNSALTGGIYDNDSSAVQIASSCTAVAKMRDSRGNVQEPLWYALIGMLRFTKESPQIIHDWSNGHVAYSQADTDEKIAQSEASGCGPSTCAHIMGTTEASELCQVCPHYGIITSPIQLGRQIAKVVEPVVEVAPTTGVDIDSTFESRDIGRFELTPDGVIFKDSFEPGHKVEEESKVRILDYPLRIKASAEDERKGGVMEIEYLHPSRGLSSFYMEKSTLAEKASFNKELLRNHITVSVGKVELMRDYITNYLQDLDRTSELQMLYSTMGWKGNDSFVLGTRFLRKGKVLQDSNLSMHLEGNYCNSIKEIGDWKVWAEATQLLGAPGLENHALSLLLGFGAPLMKMTGYDGTLINLLGLTGSGKSTMLEMISSIYGDYKELKAQKEDTYNSLIGRLGTLNNLPMVIDEITNIDFKDVSDLVYSVSQGREKTRMTAKITDRKPRTWSTLVVCSGNASLTDKLMAAKSNPEAEKMRLIEYWIADLPAFNQIAPQLHTVMKSNYGGAGTVFIQYVLNNYAEVSQFREGVQKKLEASAQSLSKERFWVAALSCALTGGFIAAQLGLVKFDVTKVFTHVVGMMKGMRGDVVADKVNYTSVLGRFLNNHSANVMFVKYAKKRSGGKVVEYAIEPQRELIVRVEHDQIGKRVYIDKQMLLMWLNRTGIPTTEFVQDAKKTGLMVSLNTNKVLGLDWANNPNNAAVPTMEFYLKDSDEISEQIDNNILALAK